MVVSTYSVVYLLRSLFIMSLAYTVEDRVSRGGHRVIGTVSRSKQKKQSRSKQNESLLVLRRPRCALAFTTVRYPDDDCLYLLIYMYFIEKATSYTHCYTTTTLSSAELGLLGLQQDGSWPELF